MEGILSQFTKILISFLDERRVEEAGFFSLGKRRQKRDILKCVKRYYKGNVQLSLFAGGRIKIEFCRKDDFKLNAGKNFMAELDTDYHCCLVSFIGDL